MVTVRNMDGEVLKLETGGQPYDTKGATFTILNPEFLPDGTIQGSVYENKTDHLTFRKGGYQVHPMEVLADFFPMVLVRYNGKWVGTEGVKTAILSAGKIFGIK